MWTYRLGPLRAKQLLFTGDVISGVTAAAWGLANASVPASELPAAVDAFAKRVAAVPRAHLAMHKTVANGVIQACGLEAAQTLSTILDGVARHNPEGVWFRRLAQARGFKAAVAWRDGGRDIPDGDDARTRIVELEAELRQLRAKL
jgi:enoyl-CoA hydratase